MSRVRKYGFGPGRLESLRMRLWRQPVRHQDFSYVNVSLEGHFTAYCGFGNEHTVEIAERHSVDLDHSIESVDRVIADLWNRGGDDPTEASAAVADQLLEWSLEDWVDPCHADDET